MGITYNTRKDLPIEHLHKLFIAVGWSDGTETPFMLENFNMPFINSTVVISAWENGCLVGCVRVLSDKIFRSVIYYLAVLPEFQNKGIGKELIKRCIEHFPDSEWLVGTLEKTASYYEKIGFKVDQGVFLSIASKWF
ncbi:GNAT family N-acetyltransferase [Clostridium sp. C2-6-12]|uniref:GNAT family N-acetyltransferase n=1 Tax=Clostridium sp. C2-6-12 TaxID=2698832 RepID=UPI00136C71C7|nr:GNAT family N-acetyltransferase [Clostridium sp. C2-6-12]